MTDKDVPPILAGKSYDKPSVFTPENLLREARRQKKLAPVPVPAVCLLDPDGDILSRLIAEGRARLHPGWPCYHTQLYVAEYDGMTLGIAGCVVGASFAVLVAEQLFASGCRLLISVTSSGQLSSVGPPPYFILIDRALRDEGTSYHYLPPSRYSAAPPAIIDALDGAYNELDVNMRRGATWTTDAPFRETAAAIETMKEWGLLAVEMEAAALYAFAEKCGKQIICFAHVTNRMGQIEGDFEKGTAAGTDDALAVISCTVRKLGYPI